MFKELVAEHYTKKGYKVHEARKVRGKSGNVYIVDMVCVGDIGHLVVSFGDEGGIEGPELGAVKRIATDIGAAPVAAVPDPTPALRRMANQVGVAIVDQDSLLSPDSTPDLRSEEQIDHPWPRSGETQTEDDSEGLWAKVRETKAKPFGWLGDKKSDPVPRTIAAKPVGLETVAPIEYQPQVAAPMRQVAAPTSRAPPSGFDPKMLVGPALYGGVTGLVLLVGWLLFG